ncbi:hypothetical protein PIB30_011176 [Stylosanthes scabra]|uniref:Reverse transcriptase zinc-binding domain-containing protein n=1 Tax=Stylosanthes scabra TaxID=79078 RepID=A0ABU6R5L9_9FABA|nr:hypothetical protein [Stylosanthes scabra]
MSGRMEKVCWGLRTRFWKDVWIGVNDTAAWTWSTNGQYSTRSFLDEVTGLKLGNPTMGHVFENIWCGLVPPRVELFTWMVMLDDINTRSALV